MASFVMAAYSQTYAVRHTERRPHRLSLELFVGRTERHYKTQVFATRVLAEPT